MPAFQRLHDIAAYWARLTPASPALWEEGQAVTWSALWQSIEDCANALDAQGAQAGERLAVVGENCVAQVVLMFAASLRRLWFVPLNARLARAEVDQLVRHAGARWLVFTGAVSPNAARHAMAAAAVPWPASGLAGVQLARAQPHSGQAPEAVPSDDSEGIAVLIYTTGTTGAPKGVMLRQRSLLAVARVSAELRALVQHDAAYGVLPLSHVYGLSSVLLATLHAGACVHLVPRFDAGATWRTITDGAITILQGVPTHYVRLLEHARAGPPGHRSDPGQAELAGHPSGHAPERPPGRLRSLYSGGAPLDLALKQAVERQFALVLHNGYGLTENGPSVCVTLPAAPRQDDSVGPALPGIELRVVDENGRPVTGGHAGRLHVRGPGVMAGYYRSPELTAQALDGEGWLDTGDMVRTDPDGAVFVLGRAKEMIIRSGFKVYPPEVEAAIQQCSGVEQAAVLGLDRGNGDQDVVAFVVWSKAGVPAAETLRAELRERLAPYKIPTRWIALPALPLAPSGKVRKAELQRLLDNGT